MENISTIEKLKYKSNNFTWVCINNPDPRVAVYLKKNYKFHPLDLEDILSGVQRPKIDEYEKYLFIVLHAPVKVSKKRQSIESKEIYIFMGQNYVITVHYDNPIIQDIFNKCRKKKITKEKYMSKGSGYFLYMIVDDIFEEGFPLLDYLTKEMNAIEKEVFDEDHSKDRLHDILLLKKDVINFRRIIMPQRAIIAQLEHKNKKFMTENLDIYFDNTVDKVEKIWNNLENLQELVSSLQATNESLISHDTNNIIKILTIFSVIMLPLTLITGFYGMNVENLPLAKNADSLIIILAILIGIVAAMISFFRYKKWL